MEDISLTTEDDPIDLTGGVSANIPSDKVAQKRAAKASFGLGDLSPGVDKLTQAILGGRENDMRQQMATQEALRAAQLKENMIRDVAGKMGNRMTPEVASVMRDMTMTEYQSNPADIFERKFAEKYVTTAMSVNAQDKNSPYQKALREDPDAVHAEADIFSNLIKFNQVVGTRLENLQAEWDNMGFMTKAANIGGQLVPFLSAARMASVAKELGTEILPGENLRTKIQNLYLLPVEERTAKLDEIINHLKANNFLDAMTFAQAVQQYSTDDEYLNNIIGITDALGVGSVLGKGVVRAAKASRATKAGEVIEEIPDFLGKVGPSKPVPHPGPIVDGGELPNIDVVRNALKDAAKSIGKPDNDIQDVISDIGEIGTAGSLHAWQKLNAVFLGNGGVQIGKDLISFMNPKRFLNEGSAMSREFGNRIVENLAERRQMLVETLGKLHVPRLTEQALQVGIKETENSFYRDYGGRVNDGIVNFRHVPAEQTLQNNDSVVMRVGAPNALPFKSSEEAKYYFEDFYNLTPGEGRIVNQGGSFWIEIERVIDETTDGVRSNMVTPKNSTPYSMWNGLLSRFRTSEDLLSEFQRGNRKIATHVPQKMTRALKDAIEETGNKVSSTERKNIETLLRRNRDDKNPNTGQRGLWYDSLREFEVNYQRQFGNLPSQEAAEHYFNYRQVSDFEFLIRNLALYRDKARLGVRNYTWMYKTEDDILRVPEFEGKKVDNLPWTGKQNATVYVHDAKTGQGGIVHTHDVLGGKNQAYSKAALDEMIQTKGYRVIQVFDPKKRPFKDIIKVNGQKLEDQVHFVVTNSVDESALSWSQLEYRPGGHSIYRDSWYVKQPVFTVGLGGRAFYYGDNAVMNFSSEAAAKKYAAAFDTAREMLKRNDPGLDQFLARNLPYSRADFEKTFKDGHLNIDTPIAYTHESRDTLATNPWLRSQYGDYVDGTRSEYDLSGLIDRSFTADRNDVLNTVAEGKVFQIAPSRQLDPYVAMNRALGQGVRNLHMADYKIQAVESWIREFGDLMEPASLEAIMKRPLYFLYKPQWKSTEGIAKDKLNAGQASQRAIVNLLQSRSELGDQLYHLQNRLVSSIYDFGGQKAADRLHDVLELPLIRDPVGYARAVAFHTKLGFFNPVQAILQAQSLAHVMAVAGPKNGSAGWAAGFIARRSLHTEDPAVLADLAKKATKWGWTEKEFLEMRDILINKTGIAEVAGEAMLRDDIFDPQFFRSKTGYWLDKGTMFFNEGERIVRLAAFAAAYREWKDVNKLTKIGNREIADIMRRSDDLSLNMTRASAASWQSGVLSIPTQFMAYNIRLMEQFMGKRLTAAEKARAFVTYSTLYGVPAGVSAATGIWPWYDDIKEEAMKRGIDLSPKYMQALSDGIISVGLSTVTGREYNVAQRFGPGGNTTIRDLLRGDKHPLEFIGGPSASIIGDIWESTDPVRRTIWAATTGNSEIFPIKGKDMLQPLSQISTANIAVKAWGIMEYGKFITQRGQQIGPADTMDAAMAMIGLTPQHIADVYLKLNANKEVKKAQDWFEQKAMDQFALALTASANNDEKSFKEYMTRYSTYVKLGNFNFADQDRIARRAMEFKPDLIDKVNWDFVRRAPQDQYISRFETFIKNRDKMNKVYK